MNKYCLAMLLSMIVTTVIAGTPEDLVQKKLSAIHTMQAAFAQTIRAKHRVVSKSSGSMALARPNRFRWQTKKPMAQIVVADGAKVWIYDVALEQVTVSKQTQHLGVAGALFLSQDNDAVARDFNVVAHHQAAVETFDLHAKSSKANFEQVRLVFKKELLTSIELDDQLGQHTTVIFSQIQMNQPESAKVFQFKIPAGVDVVQQ
ncbi:MAG: outer membrane lipoprotein chaperone LolA [Gammaproteobacteria bacterium]|nr:outer membrane lipoprotein chaperone LolA [Gammaproteobacteria bacterium]